MHGLAGLWHTQPIGEVKHKQLAASGEVNVHGGCRAAVQIKGSLGVLFSAQHR